MKSSSSKIVKRILVSILTLIICVQTVGANNYLYTAEIEKNIYDIGEAEIEKIEVADSDESVIANTDEMSVETMDENAADVEEDKLVEANQEPSNEIQLDSSEELLTEEKMAAAERIIDSIDSSRFLFEEGGREVFSESEEYLQLEALFGASVSEQQKENLANLIENGLKNKSAIIPLPGGIYTPEVIKDIFYAVKNNNPDLYYVEGGYSSTLSGGYVIAISPQYKDSSRYNEEAFATAVAKAKKSVDNSMTDLEKALALHDYLASTIAYNLDAAREEMAAGGHSNPAYDIHNAYGALVDQSCVCDGYALAYMYLLKEYGIESAFIANNSGGHAWNYVKIDGEFYNVDVTWDDPAPNREGAVQHSYMFLSDEMIQQIDDELCLHNKQDMEKYYKGQKADIAATNTMYDDADWCNYDSPFLFINNKWYYAYSDAYYNNYIGYGNISGKQVITEKSICSVGSWRVIGKTSSYIGPYSGLFNIDNELFFNKSDGIYVIDINNDTKAPVKKYAFDNTSENLYGCGYRYNAKEQRGIVSLTYGVYPHMDFTTSEVDLTDLGVALEQYTVVFKDREGSVLKTQTVERGECATSPIPPFIMGYTFTGWDQDYSNVTSDMDIHAVYSPEEYNITYVTNGGVLPGSAVTEFNIETPTFSLPIATRAGYTFGGWYMTADCAGSNLDIQVPGITGNMTYYAKWIPNVPVKPVVKPVSTSNIRVVEDGYVTDTTHTFTISSTEADVKLYYTLDGKNPTNKSAQYSAPIEISKDTVIKAVAYRENVAGEIMSTKISFADDTFVINKTELTLKEGETFEMVAEVLPSGREASNVVWTSDNEAVATVSTSGVVSAVFEGNATITGTVYNWKDEAIQVTCDVEVVPPVYTVTFRGQAGIVIKNEEVMARRDATAPEIDILPGYSFAGWDTAFASITSDLEVNAVINKENYNIIYHANGGDFVGGESFYNVESEPIELPANPVKAGFNFAGWYDNVKCEGSPVSFIPTGSIGHKDFYAKWVSERELWMRWSGMEYGDSYSAVYTGGQIKPEFDVYFGDTLLVAGKDYTAAYKNNVNVNASGLDKYKNYVLITGKGNYSGKITSEFTIEPKSIESEINPGQKDIEFDVPKVVLAYNGRVQKKAPIVTWNGRKLNNKEIRITFPDESVDAYKKVGVYDVVIEGIGNFTGTIVTTLEIVEINPKDENADVLMTSCKAKITPFTYSNSAIDFDSAEELEHVTVTYGKKVLEYGTDYSIICGADYNGVPCKDIGKYTVIIRGEGKYQGEIRTTFAINGISAKNFVVAPIAGAVYDGNAKTPEITVKTKAGDELVKGTDFTVSYSNNTNVGTASVIITGIGAYTGTVKKTFRINQCIITDLDAADYEIEFAGGSSTVSYMKNGAAPKLNISYNGHSLTEGVDYTLGYKFNNTTTPVPGKEPYIVITGKKNFRGSRIVPFTIAKTDIGTLNISVGDIAENAAAGRYMSAPVITDKNGKKLAAKTDYSATLVYKDKAGNVLDKKSRPVAGDVIYVYVTGVNNYTGTISGSYRVFTKGMSLSSARITIKKESLSKLRYSGEKIVLNKDDLEVVVNKKLLTADQYEIDENSYVNNVNKGTASVTIIGKGEYAGSKVFKFSIASYAMSWWQKIFS